MMKLLEGTEISRPSIRPLLALIFQAVLFLLCTCTDARLEPLAGDVVYVDDKLSISGSFCTSPPDEVPFPVKILIVIDQSASLQCTDPGNNRLTALNNIGDDLDALPNVEFGVVGFASWSRITEFTPDWNEAQAALIPESGQGGPATDYQGALATVLSMLEQDMVDSGPAETARTKYVVLFMSDGVPEPRCRAGSDDGDTPPDSLYGVCNTSASIPDDEYVDMLSTCPEYNQESQILKKVQDIVALADSYGAGELTFNTFLLFADEEVIAQVCGDVSQFGYIRDEAEPLLQAMAEEGGGTYRDVNISTEIDFLDFSYESLEAPYQVAEFFAINMNTIPSEAGPVLDSDGDGLYDALEFDAGLDRLSTDTDGDWFSDLFEWRFLLHGFDPQDGEVPAGGCDGLSDRDGDGLLECEENFLGTDPLLADSDGDRIPDGVEFRLEMDPTVYDTQADPDFDGRLSGLEVRAGTHPQRFDEDDTLLYEVHYRVTPGETLEDQTLCYDFLFQNLTLVPALSEGETKGINRIYLVVEEEPTGLAGSRGRFHVACIEARYLGNTYRDPPSGLIEGLSPDRFVELGLFDPDEHCLGVGKDPTRGIQGGAP